MLVAPLSSGMVTLSLTAVGLSLSTLMVTNPISQIDWFGAGKHKLYSKVTVPAKPVGGV